MEFLLSKGANPNVIGIKSNWSALLSSTSQGYRDITKMLIEYGADVNHSQSDGWTPLHVAAREGHPKIARILITANPLVGSSNSDGDTSLIIAAKQGNFEIVQMILNLIHSLQDNEEAFAIVNHKNRSGLTAISAAAQRGHAKILHMLREVGAVVPYSDFGWTYLRIIWISIRHSLGVGERVDDI